MIDQIVGLINGGFDGLHQAEIILGIADSIHRIDSEGAIEFIPGIVKLGTDEAVYAGIDDVRSIIIYHKMNAASLSFGARNSGYGDSRKNIDSINCSIIALWDTRVIKLYSPDMMLLLRSRMPQLIKGIPEVGDATIAPSVTTLDTKQIFESEYRFSKPYLLPMYIKMLQINYTIQLNYDPVCIDKCINC